MSHKICRARRALFFLERCALHFCSTWSAPTSCRSSTQRVRSASRNAASSTRWSRSCAPSTFSPVRRSGRPTFRQQNIDGEFFRGCFTEYEQQGVLCFPVYCGHSFQVICIEVLPKQRSMFLVGYPQCSFSHMAVQVLWSLDVPFETLNVLADEALRQGRKEYSSCPTFPLLCIGGEFFGGCDITVGMHI